MRSLFVHLVSWPARFAVPVDTSMSDETQKILGLQPLTPEPIVVEVITGASGDANRLTAEQRRRFLTRVSRDITAAGIERVDDGLASDSAWNCC